MQSPADRPTPPPGCPAHENGQNHRTPLYTGALSADSAGVYDRLRKFGPAAPVELAPGVEASLVTDYAAALHVLQNPDMFPRDARRWRALNEGRVPADSPVRPMMEYLPGPLMADGAEHLRLRQAMTDSLARVDTHRLTRLVDRSTKFLISQFEAQGRVDLVGNYAQLVPLLVFNELFGCPGEIGDRVVYGISGMFDGANADEAKHILIGALAELVQLKHSKPGDDITSWLLEHPAALTDEEMIPQLIQLMGAGMQPLADLIASALLVILRPDDQNGGELLVEDAIDSVLWNNPPIANYAAHYPVQDVDLGGSKLDAGDPVLISFAAANSDPSLSTSRQTLSRRAHLAWGAGPHACPAKDPARLITARAIEILLNQLPDLELAVDQDKLVFTPGPFHVAVTELPARFTRPVREEARPTPRAAAAPGSSGPQREQTSAAPQQKGFWSGFLSWWKG
ncbi:cytochrome P450 [Streptomyces hebeiensis]